MAIWSNPTAEKTVAFNVNTTGGSLVDDLIVMNKRIDDIIAINKTMDMNINKKRPTVTNYYVEHFKKCNITYIRTVLEFADGSKETVECREDNFDPYYGFVTCYAKHIAKVFLGKNISDMADYWIIKRPKQIAKERAKEEMRIAEEKRIAERDKKRREKQRIRMEAIRRKEAYEARKLAEEKYGVPADWNEGKA